MFIAALLNRASALTVVVCALAATPALAQQDQQRPVEEIEAETDAQDIVVTGLRRETLLQDTPIAITALSGDTLARMGADGLDGFFRTVPGLVVQDGETGAGRGRMSVRGIRSQGEATLALYYGETPIIASNGTASDAGGRTGDLALYDIDRIEVLRGPQGTLYGSSSMGGAMRVLLNEPNTRGFEGTAKLEASATHEGGLNYYAAAAINLPLSTDLAIRIVGSQTRSQGYIDNVRLGLENTNDQEQTNIRAAIKYMPRDTLSFTFTGIRQDSTLGDSGFYRTTLKPFETNSPTLLSYDEGFTLFSGEADWDIGFAKLIAVSSWQRSTTERATDATTTIAASIAAPAAGCRIYFGLTAPASCSTAQIAAYREYAASRSPGLFYAELDNTVLTQEIRLSSNGTGPLTWTIGGYYENRDDHVDSYVVRAGETTGRVIRPLDVTGLRYIQTDLSQWAVFGEGTYALTPRLNATAGIRYYDYTKTVSGEVLQVSGPTSQAPSPFTRTRTSENGTVLKFGLDYKLADPLLVYGLASQGFRPGGTNNTPGIPADLIAYESDGLWNYELGVKTSWFDGALTINLAGYRIDWDNTQVSTRTADNIFSFITNAGAARTEGAELEITARPVTGFSLTGTLNYTDAYLTADQVNSESLPSASIGRAGDKIPYVPRWSGSASAGYDWSFSDTLQGLARVDYSYTGEYPNVFRPTVATYRVIGDYGLLSSRIGLQGARWDAAIFARNLLNARPATFSDGGTQIVSPRPRTLGLTVGLKF